MPDPGEAVIVRYRKWDETPHWTYPSVYLGADAHGHWIGLRPGTELSGPRSVTTDRHFVQVFPFDRGFSAGFYERTRPLIGVAIYVDITTPARWEADGGHSVSLVDLDLDVLEEWNGHVLIDDEDEFALHQVALGYPPDVITAARSECTSVFAALQCGDEPFGSAGPQWLSTFMSRRRSRRT